MKNITLLSALLLTLGSVSAQAQVPFRRAAHSASPIEALKAKVARSMGKASFKDIKTAKDQRSATVRLGVLARQRRATEEAYHEYKPQHQIEYAVNDDTGNYEKSAEYTFTYAPNGEVATQLTDDGTTIVKTEYTYDDNFNVTQLLNAESTDGGATYTPSEKRDQTFDPIVTDLVIEKNRYSWNADDAKWDETGDAYKRTITRDADDNVTSAVISVPYEGKYEDTKRVTNTFDPVTKACTTYKFEELGYNDDRTDLVWSETNALKDILWHETNGQLVSDYSEWMNYDNVISSATFVYHEDDAEVTGGYITVDYNPNGSYQEVIDYSVAFPAKEITTVTYNEDKEEYVYEHKYYEAAEQDDEEDANENVELTEDDLQEYEKTVYLYDDHDNLISESNYMLNEDGTDLEQIDGTRYDYTYDDKTGAEKEMVVSTYDYDSGKYAPLMKVVTDAYTDITAGINTTKSNVKNAPVEVYNLQGIRTNATSAKGVYIIRQGNVVKKVVK